MKIRLREACCAAVAVVLLAQLFLASPASAAPPFSPNVRIDDDLGVAEQRRAASVADPAGNVFVAWQDGRNGDFDIYVAGSRDGGRSFDASVGLRWDGRRSANQERPALALGPKGELVVAWQEDYFTYLDFDIFASVSFDGGITFAAPVRVSDSPGGTTQLAPSLAIDFAGRVFVAWQDFRSGNGDIRLARASLGAPFVFEPSVRVDDDRTTKTQSTPSVAVDSLGTVFVAYHDNRTGDANVYLARSTDRGATFAPSVRIDDTGVASEAQGLVSLAADSLGNLFTVWQDSRNGDFDIYFARSTDGGRSFSPNLRVDNAPGSSPQLSPRVAVGAAGTVYVAWEDGRNIDSDIYFSYSINQGSSFTSSVRVDDAPDSASDPAYQYGPQVVESKTGLVSIAWQDSRIDNGDVYGSVALLPVGSALRVRVSVGSEYVAPGEPVTLDVLVTSNGTGVDGAAITFSTNASGAFAPAVGLGSGLYRASFTPSPSLAIGTKVALTAHATKAGFVPGASRAGLEVRPRIDVSLDAPWDLLAIGQSMEIVVRATTGGSPLPAADVSLVASMGGHLGSTWGVTDAAGTWRTVLTAIDVPSGGVLVLTAGVSFGQYVSGSASRSVTILLDPLPLEMHLAANRWEMMSYETATITVRLTSAGADVVKARVTATTRNGGNLSSAQDHGDGTYSFQYDAPSVVSPSWTTIYVRADVGGYATARDRVVLLVDPNKTNPADPTQLFVFVSPESDTMPPDATIRILLYLITAEGYAVSGASVTAYVRPGRGVATAPVDELNGVYAFYYTAPSLTDTGVLVRIDATKYGYAPVSVRFGLTITS